MEFVHPSVIMQSMNKRQLIGLLMYVMHEQLNGMPIEVKKNNCEEYYKYYEPMIIGNSSDDEYELYVYAPDEKEDLLKD